MTTCLGVLRPKTIIPGKENIEQTLKKIQKNLGKDKFKKTERVERIIYERFGTFQ